MYYVNNGDLFCLSQKYSKGRRRTSGLTWSRNYFNNNQHVKIFLTTLKVSAVCTVQQYPNVMKFMSPN